MMSAESDEDRLLSIQQVSSSSDDNRLIVSTRDKRSCVGRHRDSLLCLVGGLVLFAAIAGIVVLVRNMPIETQRVPVLLVSMDGFRFDYLTNESALADPLLPYRELPHLRNLIKTGTHLRDGLIASFPTKTFPNHWSLVTGMYEESHGIVGNIMYDPVFNATFTQSNTEPRWWNMRDPIWLYARRQGLKTASFFWPGSTVPDRSPQIFVEPYDASIPFYKRVDSVIEWLKTCDFVTLYFEEPDTSGHNTGPYGAATTTALENLDSMIGRLIKGLDRPVNIIITADHGMTEISPSRVIVLETMINVSDVILTETSPVVGIWPKQNVSLTTLFAQLNDSLPAQNGLMSVYLQSEIPLEFHFRNNRRIPPLVIIAREGYSTVQSQSQVASMCCGNHGYNNSLPSMHPLLLANGPAFRNDGYAHPESARNVDVLPLLCKLLNIPIPADINGSLTGLSALLRT